MDSAGSEAECDSHPGAIEVIVFKVVKELPVIVILVCDLLIIGTLIRNFASVNHSTTYHVNPGCCSQTWNLYIEKREVLRI